MCKESSVESEKVRRFAAMRQQNTKYSSFPLSQKYKFYSDAILYFYYGGFCRNDRMEGAADERRKIDTGVDARRLQPQL